MVSVANKKNLCFNLIKFKQLNLVYMRVKTLCSVDGTQVANSSILSSCNHFFKPNFILSIELTRGNKPLINHRNKYRLSFDELRRKLQNQIIKLYILKIPIIARFFEF